MEGRPPGQSRCEHQEYPQAPSTVAHERNLQDSLGATTSRMRLLHTLNCWFT